MAMPAENPPAASRHLSHSWLWLGLAVLACLAVVFANGAPLYYYDSGGYLDNGMKVLRQLGVIDPQGVADGAGQGAVAGQGAALEDNTVNASRSVIYSLLSTALAVFLGAVSIPLFHTLVLFLAVLLPARVVHRLYRPDVPVHTLVAFPVLAACLGALPFYVAYVMPDIMTGVLLLMIATLAVFVRRMSMAEIAGAIVLGGLAIVSHLSHLAIGGLSLGLVFLVSLVLHGRRWWMPVLAVGLIVGIGLGERFAFSFVARTVSNSEVVYHPFLTARIIQDGPGRRFLQEHCPDEEIPTCILQEAFSKSSDPMRFTASHILFERSPELGSFRLLPEDQQNAISKDQVRFFLRVLKAYPVRTVGALLGNTLTQAQMTSIEMTIPEPSVFVGISSIPSVPPGLIKEGRLSADRGWITTVDRVHRLVYAVSLVTIAVLCLWPRLVARDMRFFALMLLLGILVNAFVCGGVSQPANRYGARVVWLLPYLAAFLAMVAATSKNGKRQV